MLSLYTASDADSPRAVIKVKEELTASCIFYPTSLPCSWGVPSPIYLLLPIDLLLLRVQLLYVSKGTYERGTGLSWLG